MNAQQAENLRILIRHMETKCERQMLNMLRVHELCGTPACALGEACAIASLGLARAGKEGSGCALLIAGRYAGYFEAASIVFGCADKDVDRIFGGSVRNVWRRNDVTPQEWAVEARKVLAENGYSMEPQDDGFGAFVAKVREPLPVEVAGD